MTRLAQRGSLFIVFALLASPVIAQDVESIWVAWRRDVATWIWERVSVWTTHQQCKDNLPRFRVPQTGAYLSVTCS